MKDWKGWATRLETEELNSIFTSFLGVPSNGLWLQNGELSFEALGAELPELLGVGVEGGLFVADIVEQVKENSRAKQRERDIINRTCGCLKKASDAHSKARVVQ